MTDQWGRFKESNRGRVMAHLGYENNLEVYEPTESYQTDGGFDVSYPGSPDDTIDAEIVPPDEVADRDAGGTDVEADIFIFVADDTSLAFTGYGESGEATAEVVDTDTGERYEIQTKTNRGNGLLRLTGVSVD